MFGVHRYAACRLQDHGAELRGLGNDDMDIVQERLIAIMPQKNSWTREEHSQ